MTVTNGRDYQNGGGIGAFGESEVVLLRVNVTGNWAGKRGGGLYASWRATIIDSEFFGNGCLDFVCDGGAVYGDGRTTVEKSSFISNTAGVGAAIYNGGHLTVANSILLSNTAWGAGGAIARRHTIITNSWLAHNQAPKGGALYGEPGDEVSINGSTLSDNSATEEGGAIWIVDEPNPPGFVRIVNSTLSNNSSDGEGGAIFIESHPFYSFEADVHITNSTLNRNSAAAGGSIHSISTTVEITNSIVANSLDGGNCSGMPLASHGNNIDSDGTCGLDQVGDLSNVNPLLLPLDDNGGQTPTHALFQSSPAVDAAKSEGCPDIDQRGVPRPFDGDGDLDPVCDIGAYELNVALEVRHNYLPLIIQAEP
ncbi:MAG: choice-of-anchor Q domain-containing protein [Candidatus Promineifilaceae bacterium]|nr:choice-of-anchor Q domain-containing protein [Candidatus Promineifilaceae bacterium]